jgi:hypothetical protein
MILWGGRVCAAFGKRLIEVPARIYEGKDVDVSSLILDERELYLRADEDVPDKVWRGFAGGRDRRINQIDLPRKGVGLKGGDVLKGIDNIATINLTRRTW